MFPNISSAGIFIDDRAMKASLFIKVSEELYDRYVQAFADSHQTAPLELDEFEQMFWDNEPLQKVMLDDKRKKREYKKFQEAMTKVSKRWEKKTNKLIKKGEAELLW